MFRSLALLALVCAIPGLADAPATKETRLFDGKTLDGWTVTKFGNEGKVTVKDGAIVLERGKMLTGITLARKDFPTMDYEVSFEAKKLDGNDFFGTTTFPVGKEHCSFVLGGWGGQVVGLSNIDGSNASENETNKTMEFKKNQWYEIRLRITSSRIVAWIDKDKVVDLDTTDRKISIHIACRPSRPFGISTWDTVGAVRDIQVRKLTTDEIKAADKAGE